METAQDDLEKKFDGHLNKLYMKIETETLNFANKAIEASQRPGWATLTIVAALSSLSVGLIVKMVGGR